MTPHTWGLTDKALLFLFLSAPSLVVGSFLEDDVMPLLVSRTLFRFCRPSFRNSRSLSNMSASTAPIDPVEQSKKLCAYAAVQDNLKPHHKIIGIGSGSTVVYVAECIGKMPNKSEFVCVPTGFQSKQLIIDNNIQLGGLEENPTIDIAFDGADEIDSDLNCIKGGGACLLQEKLVADSSENFIIVADDRKNTGVLGKGWKKGIPIEVIPNAYNKIIKELKALGGAPKVRPGAPAKAGPVITDNGNFIIDCDFGEIPAAKVAELNSKIKAMVGVVETGLFVGMASKAYIGNSDGTVTTLTV